MLSRTTRMIKGLGIGLMVGMALGAAGSTCICGKPSKRRVKRRLIHTADCIEDAFESLCCMMK